MCRQEENQFGKEEAMKNIVLDYVRGSIILITLSQKEFKYMSGDHAETLTECRCALQFVATYVQVAGFQETARASSGGEKKVPDWRKLLGGIGKDVGRIECSPHSFPFKKGEVILKTYPREYPVNHTYGGPCSTSYCCPQKIHQYLHQ